MLLLALAGVLIAWLAGLVRILRGIARMEEPARRVPDRDRWPSVAMVVPERNEERWLPASLPTLLAQDYRDLEIAEDMKRARRAKRMGFRIHLAFTEELAFHHGSGAAPPAGSSRRNR